MTVEMTIWEAAKVLACVRSGSFGDCKGDDEWRDAVAAKIAAQIDAEKARIRATPVSGDASKAAAFAVALAGSVVRDAHTIGTVATLADVKPVSLATRVERAAKAMRELGIVGEGGET